MNPFTKTFKLRPLVALCALVLSSCGTTNTAPFEQPLSANICETQAALVNPHGTDSGIGGTGIRVARNGNNGGGEGGIGGTGVVASANKPVFGTGGVGGTGIVGVITGFASICVNGIEVNYDGTTPVWENGKPSAISQLAVGQVVSVTAVENGQQMTARGIGVIQAVVGPISTLNVATGELRVMGQKVNAARIDLTRLKVGDWLRVSGHILANGEVMPSNIQAVALPSSQANMQVQLRGSARNMAGKSVLLGDTRVDLSALSAAPSFANGDELWLSGVWNGQQLQAHEVTVNPTLQGLGRVEKIVVEGYIHGSSTQSLNLGAQTLVLSDRTQIVGGSSRDLVMNRRVQVTGRLGADQRIAVDRVEFSRQTRRGSASKSSSSQEDGSGKTDTSNLVKTSSDDSGSSNSGSGSSNSGKGSSNSGSSSGSSGSGSSGSGSSGSGSGSGSGSSGSNSGSTGSSGSGSGSSGSGSSNSGSSNSGSSGSSGSGSGSSGKGGSGSGKSSSK